MTAILWVMGLQNEKQFQNYHRVLNRAKWSSRALNRILLHLLVQLFVPDDAPIVVGIDETIECRRGAKIAAKGIYRDPVRSSKEFFVKTSGSEAEQKGGGSGTWFSNHSVLMSGSRKD